MKNTFILALLGNDSLYPAKDAQEVRNYDPILNHIKESDTDTDTAV